MADFAKLAPAFELRMQTTPQLIMGEILPLTGMAVGPIGHGTLKSVPGYGVESLEGEVVNGADVFYKTALGVNLDFRSVIKPSEGELVYFQFQGYIEANEKTAAVMRGDPDNTGTEWGNSFLSGRFETGNLKWKHVTNKVFVGSQRLLKKPGQPLFVEINLSEVIA